MKTLSESDRRGVAMFGVVGCMASLFVVCLFSTEKQSMICFCLSCTAMLSMMQLASLENPGFCQRYGWLVYFFAYAPVPCSVVYLCRERFRILDENASLL